MRPTTSPSGRIFLPGDTRPAFPRYFLERGSEIITKPFPLLSRSTPILFLLVVVIPLEASSSEAIPLRHSDGLGREKETRVGRNYPPPPPRASLIGWLVIIKRDDNKSKGELNSRSDVELSFVRSAYRRGRKFRVNCCTLYAKRGPRARYRERSLERVMARSPPPSCETSNRLSPFQRATYLVPAD